MTAAEKQQIKNTIKVLQGYFTEVPISKGMALRIEQAIRSNFSIANEWYRIDNTVRQHQKLYQMSVANVRQKRAAALKLVRDKRSVGGITLNQQLAERVACRTGVLAFKRRMAKQGIRTIKVHHVAEHGKTHYAIKMAIAALQAKLRTA